MQEIRRLVRVGAASAAGSLLLMADDYTPREVAALWADGAIQLIDVRERHEHDAGRIAGTRLIELGSLQREAGTIDPTRPVVFYCHSGARSAMASQAFEQAGFDAQNMTGGMPGGPAAGLPIEPDDGYVADP